MQHFGFEILPGTGEWRLRFLGPGGKLLDERPFDPAQIEALIARVEPRYDPFTPLTHGDRSPSERHLEAVESESAEAGREVGQGLSGEDLAALGQSLYSWLDGPKRWLARAWEGTADLALDIDVAGKLRHLPWELLRDRGDYFCTLRPFTPVRRVGSVVRDAVVQNRPLRVLSMACAPEDVWPVLDFEGEEALIFKATLSQPIDLEVEESGSLEGLKQAVDSFDSGYFDVLHLSGHADVFDGQPRFVMEDESGRSQLASAKEIAGALSGRWPRLIFLSGCSTGQAASSGAIPSMCEALVLEGAPAVVGWALPVEDETASRAAAELYSRLAKGSPIDEAVALTRQALYQQRLPDWHLLRIYADRTDLGKLVTPLRTIGRERLHRLPADLEFLDRERRVKVCPRAQFVGRRRILQRCLAVLKSFPGEPEYAEGLLLHGMGGLGKSSLAARLCDRLSYLEREVWVGRIDELSFLAQLRNRIEDPVALSHFDAGGLPLQTRLRLLLRDWLNQPPSLLFIFDAFEHNLIARPDGMYVPEPSALDVLAALLAALNESASECRVIITCRFIFDLPGPARLHTEALESMGGADLTKKLQRLQIDNLPDRSGRSGETRRQVVKLAAGNPLLLERMDEFLQRGVHDTEEAGAPLTEVARKFCDEMGCPGLLASQSDKEREILALLSTFDGPVEQSVLESIAATGSLEVPLQGLAAAGLVEAVYEPLLRMRRFHVSPLLRPMLAADLEDPSRAERWAGAAQRALDRFAASPVAGGADRKEIDLLVAACGLFTASRRYETAGRLLIEKVDPYLLALGHYDRLISLHESMTKNLKEPQLVAMSAIDVANARLAQGDVTGATEAFRGASEGAKQVHDPQGQAIALNNLAFCYYDEGYVEKAIPVLEEALALARSGAYLSVELAATSTRGLCDEAKGEYLAAQELHTAAIELARAHGQEAEEVSCLLSLGNCSAALGSPAKAVSLFETALAKLEGREPLTWGTTLQSLAEALIDLDRIGDAIAKSERGYQIGLTVNSPGLQIENLQSLARARLLSGQLEEAEKEAEKASQLTVPRYRHHAYLLTGLAQYRQGKRQPAAGSFTAALAAAESLLVRYGENLWALETRALALSGLAACGGGGCDEATRALSVVGEIHERYRARGRARAFASLRALLAPPPKEA